MGESLIPSDARDVESRALQPYVSWPLGQVGPRFPFEETGVLLRL